MKLPIAFSVCLTAAAILTSTCMHQAAAEPATSEATIGTTTPIAVPAPSVQSVSPEMQAAVDRVQDCTTQLDTARKQLTAAKSLVRAAEADLKAARADKEALTLREQAQGLAKEAGLTPLSSVRTQPVPIAQAHPALPAQTVTTAPAQPVAAKIDIAPHPPAEAQALPKVKELDFNAQPASTTDPSGDVPILR